MAFDPYPAARSRAAQREKLERVGRGKKKVDSDEDSDGEDDLATSREKTATMRKAHEEAMARVMRELEESRTREAALLERLSRAERN